MSILSEKIKESVRENVAEQIRGNMFGLEKEVVEEQENEEITESAVLAAIGIAGFGALALHIKSISKNVWMKSQLDKDLPRSEDKMASIVRAIRLAKTTEDVRSIEKMIEGMRKSIEAAQDKADAMTIADVPDKYVVVSFNRDKAKQGVLDSYKKFLKTLGADLDKTARNAFAQMDAILFASGE